MYPKWMQEMLYCNPSASRTATLPSGRLPKRSRISFLGVVLINMHSSVWGRRRVMLPLKSQAENPRIPAENKVISRCARRAILEMTSAATWRADYAAMP
jgi:hypothetical protein